MLWAMPMVEVQIVGDADALPSSLVQRLADAIGEVLGSRPQGVWVKLAVLSPLHYAENGGMAEDGLPVFVSILERSDSTLAARTEQSLALARAVGAACERSPANVHIVYEAAGAGRVSFGGVLVG